MTHTPNSPIQSNAETCEASIICRSALDQILLQGAQQMQATAIEAEVQQYIQKHSNLHDQSGRRLVVRNGTLPTRRVHTCAGSIEVTQPRINDRPCLLVIVGSLPDGTKEVVGVLDGERESKLGQRQLFFPVWRQL